MKTSHKVLGNLSQQTVIIWWIYEHTQAKAYDATYKLTFSKQFTMHSLTHIRDMHVKFGVWATVKQSIWYKALRAKLKNYKF